jgi:hypothetical protein
MKRLSRFGLAFAMLLSMTAFGAGATLAADPTAGTCDPATCTIEDATVAANDEAYWEARFGEGITCTKTDAPTSPVVLAEDHYALIIKNSSFNYIWQPAAAGTYSTSEGTSHYIVCDSTVEDEFIPPDGEIFGPCADPAYYAFMDNSAGNTLVKMRFRWYNNNGLNTSVKWLAPGDTFTTWQHWAKPGTYVSLSYKDPNTGLWVLLDKELVVKGRYPVCEYTPGWTHTAQV